jgi:succinate dehydrogenase / fumarate reductase cytochrome b subunit
MKNNRPTSPHLFIYKIQMMFITSIAHRASGVLLFASICLFTIWLSFFILSDFNKNYFDLFYLKLISFCLYIISLAFVYHVLNGVRHLLWDTGRGLQLKTVNLSGILVLTFSLIACILIWFFI